MLLLSLILLPISISSMRKITRAEGAMLLAGYCTYVSLRAVFFG
jgi:Ca2+/Na+ antiporter